MKKLSLSPALFKCFCIALRSLRVAKLSTVFSVLSTALFKASAASSKLAAGLYSSGAFDMGCMLPPYCFLSLLPERVSKTPAILLSTTPVPAIAAPAGPVEPEAANMVGIVPVIRVA